MNNSLLTVETKNPTDEISFGEADEKFQSAAIIQALERLSSHAAFKRYTAILRKRLGEQMENLVKETDDAEAHRIQGFIKGLKYALDLDSISKHYKNKLERTYGTKNGSEKNPK